MDETLNLIKENTMKRLEGLPPNVFKQLNTWCFIIDSELTIFLSEYHNINGADIGLYKETISIKYGEEIETLKDFIMKNNIPEECLIKYLLETI